MEHGLPDLMADFCFIPADRLDIFLVQDDAVRSRAEVEYAYLGGGYTLENSKQQSAFGGTDMSGVSKGSLERPRPILHEHREIVDSLAELRRNRIQRFLNQMNEVLPPHLPPSLNPSGSGDLLVA